MILDESLDIKGEDLDSQLNVKDWLGMNCAAGGYKIGGVEKCLVSDNDDHGKTFDEIADIIESNPDGLWAEGTY